MRDENSFPFVVWLLLVILACIKYCIALCTCSGKYIDIYFSLKITYLYTLAVSPSLGGSQQHKEITRIMGVLLRSFSNDEGPSRVWMALLEQHSPSSNIIVEPFSYCQILSHILL